MPRCMQAVELLREVAHVEPAEYERMHDSGGVRNVANFLVELADRSELLQHRLPKLIVDHLCSGSSEIKSTEGCLLP